MHYQNNKFRAVFEHLHEAMLHETFDNPSSSEYNTAISSDGASLVPSCSPDKGKLEAPSRTTLVNMLSI